jgi:hypothetical protein
VKYELVRDAILRGRTEEALVRIVVALKDGGDTAAADRVARDVVPTLVHDVYRALPTY